MDQAFNPESPEGGSLAELPGVEIESAVRIPILAFQKIRKGGQFGKKNIVTCWVGAPAPLDYQPTPNLMEYSVPLFMNAPHPANPNAHWFGSRRDAYNRGQWYGQTASDEQPPTVRKVVLGNPTPPVTSAELYAQVGSFQSYIPHGDLKLEEILAMRSENSILIQMLDGSALNLTPGGQLRHTYEHDGTAYNLPWKHNYSHLSTLHTDLFGFMRSMIGVES